MALVEGITASKRTPPKQATVPLPQAPPPPLLPQVPLSQRSDAVVAGIVSGAISPQIEPPTVPVTPTLDTTDDESGDSLSGDFEETGEDSASGESRELEVSGCPPPAHPRDHQGKNGMITAGLFEVERVIGIAHVHVDTSGTHASCSYHYRGEAVDVDADEVLWLILYPHRSLFVELLSPWGLYHNGVRFYDTALLAEHSGRNAHIHVAYTGGPATIDRVFKLKPGRGQSTGPSNLPPAVPRRSGTVYDRWKPLVRRFTKDIPKHHSTVKGNYHDLWRVFT